MFIVTGSTSTSTGVAPQSATTLPVAGNVYAGTSTSSPGPSPSASTATCSAAVPDDTATACSTPTASASSDSNSLDLRPHRELPGLEHLADLGELLLAHVGRGQADYCVSAGFRARYHAIVLSRPSSSSTFASKPMSSRAFSTFGIRSSTST